VTVGYGIGVGLGPHRVGPGTRCSGVFRGPGPECSVVGSGVFRGCSGFTRAHQNSPCLVLSALLSPPPPW
jgi:hypothetical protein